MRSNPDLTESGLGDCGFQKSCEFTKAEEKPGALWLKKDEPSTWRVGFVRSFYDFI
jgi:hypothetical protein